uniref:Glucose-methanol-choline oxidoreductase C-terminal domain-containing protein n=1 Tax=Palpitomonas bilix TaxID=652834 RepID=A0A7S3CXA1_9EUKA|mmetsp:Transcript_13133/g.34344  ORF Transcript_13133/g.34344 Transcript_13133/m.34344 type:complete len:150 (+) Transcript_13133:533-982(+)
MWIESADPAIPPCIDPNYLHDTYDVEVLMDGMKTVREIASQPELQKAGVQEIIDETILHNPSSAEYMEEYVRKSAITIYHPIGTCKMGRVDDESTVVDERLRVKGFQNLRVADASVMPFIISGNTNAATVMIGEKAADLIKEDALRRPH